MTDAPPPHPTKAATTGSGGEACPSWCVTPHTPERDKYGATHRASSSTVTIKPDGAVVYVNVFTTPHPDHAGVHVWGSWHMFTPARPIGERGTDLDADSAHAMATILDGLLDGLTGQPGERKATRAQYAAAVARVHELAALIRAGAGMLDEADPSRRALRPSGGSTA